MAVAAKKAVCEAWTHAMATGSYIGKPGSSSLFIETRVSVFACDRLSRRPQQRASKFCELTQAAVG